MSRFISLALLTLLLFGESACGSPYEYSAESIEAWIVNAETGEPMEGAIVVAHWILKFGIESAGSEDLVVMETVTDADGRFYFPAWGPVRIPKELPRDARLMNQDPEIIVYKPRYGSDGFYNSREDGPFQDKGPSVRKSQWNAKTIPFKRFSGSLEAYSRAQMGLPGLDLDNCKWKKIPRLLVAIDQDATWLESQGVRNARAFAKTLDDIASSAQGDNCGSVQEFFKEYLQ